jgi:hypothetical protein
MVAIHLQIEIASGQDARDSLRLAAFMQIANGPQRRNPIRLHA